MTSFYGSSAEPIELFGEDTPELLQFYVSRKAMFPGASMLCNRLINAWDMNTKYHKFTMPNKKRIVLPTTDIKSVELVYDRDADWLPPVTFEYEEVTLLDRPEVSLAANVTHAKSLA